MLAVPGPMMFTCVVTLDAFFRILKNGCDGRITALSLVTAAMTTVSIAICVFPTLSVVYTVTLSGGFVVVVVAGRPDAVSFGVVTVRTAVSGR